MDYAKLTIVWVLVAMIFFQEIHNAHGRQLTVGKLNDVPKFHTHSQQTTITTAHIRIHKGRRIEAAYTELPPPVPTQVPAESHSPPLLSNDLDNFRPTAPGRSPGAGH